jgi:hypothetical protein
MSIFQLLLLGVTAMIGLAALRLVRVHFGRTPLPEGKGKFLFLLLFVVVPPIALGKLVEPGGPTQSDGLPSLPIYAAILVALMVLMSIAAMIVGQVTHSRSGRLVRLALNGSEGDAGETWPDPPLTATLAESLASVNRANAVFPRGHDFPAQIDRSGFRFAWDALDAATVTLETQIADDDRLGIGVASAARVGATDARSRLETLHGLAVNHGQVWAAA